jgi:hypothetical protein
MVFGDGRLKMVIYQDSRLKLYIKFLLFHSKVQCPPDGVAQLIISISKVMLASILQYANVLGSRNVYY